MSRQSWSELLTSASASGTAVTNTTTETSIYPNVTIPANYMQDGRNLRLTLKGTYASTSSQSLIFRLRWGGITGTVLAVTPFLTTPSGTITRAPFELELIMQTYANGSSGSLMCLGNVAVHQAYPLTGGSATNGSMFAGMAGPTATGSTSPVTVDLTADTALALTVAWGSAATGNSLTGSIYMIEALN